MGGDHGSAAAALVPQPEQLVRTLRKLVLAGAANVRNDIAHGLIDDAGAPSYNSFTCGGSAFRLVMFPGHPDDGRCRGYAPDPSDRNRRRPLG
jgi:hypothetical protein